MLLLSSSVVLLAWFAFDFLIFTFCIFRSSTLSRLRALFCLLILKDDHYPVVIRFMQHTHRYQGRLISLSTSVGHQQSPLDI